jgi:hypothetical protein
MLGAVPPEFELELREAQPLIKSRSAARTNTTATQERFIKTSDKVGGAGTPRNYGKYCETDTSEADSIYQKRVRRNAFQCGNA